MASIIKLIYREKIEQAITETFNKDEIQPDNSVTSIMKKLGWENAFFKEWSETAIRSCLKDRVIQSQAEPTVTFPFINEESIKQSETVVNEKPKIFIKNKSFSREASIKHKINSEIRFLRQLFKTVNKDQEQLLIDHLKKLKSDATSLFNDTKPEAYLISIEDSAIRFNIKFMFTCIKELKKVEKRNDILDCILPYFKNSHQELLKTAFAVYEAIDRRQLHLKSCKISRTLLKREESVHIKTPSVNFPSVLR